MSKESVKKFFEDLSKNESLKKGFVAATKESSAEIQKAVEAQAASIAEFAKKAGYVFTAEELLENNAGEEKLCMDDLDSVAGGFFMLGKKKYGLPDFGGDFMPSRSPH